MNFAIEHLGKASERVGNLEIKSKFFATPCSLLNTRGGAVPHLTKETLAYLHLPASITLLPYQYHAKQTDILQQYKKGMKSFLGMGETVMLLTVQDPAATTRSGYNTNKQISVFHNTNRELIDSQRYMSFVSAARPDIWVPLCDADTPKDASKKRISRAVKKSLEFLDSCLEQRDADVYLKNSTAVIASVQGGLDVTARKYSATETARRPVAGFLLDGFHINGETAESLCWPEVKEAFQETIQCLPKEKPRFYPGAASPDLVFNLFAAGIDVFDSSYPNLVTERECALIFPTEFTPNVAYDKVCTGSKPNFELSMRETDLRLDMNPLVDGCECYTCRNFTRAYLHHLLEVKEMLGKVLLSLHNIHHYSTFFSSLREAAKLDQIESFKNRIMQ